MTKICPKCGIEKELDVFGKDKSNRDGLAGYCKNCSSLYRRNWYANETPTDKAARRTRKNTARNKQRRENVEVARANGRAAYRNAPKDVVARRKAALKAYREENAEELKIYAKKYCKANKEKLATQSAAYRSSDKRKAYIGKRQRTNTATTKRCTECGQEKPLEEYYIRKDSPDGRRDKCNPCMRPRKARESNIYRNRKIGVEEDFTVEMVKFVKLFWGNSCAVCGRTADEEGQNLAIDHWLPLSGGHALVVDNAVQMCRSCNSSKRDRLPANIYDAAIVGEIETKIAEQAEAWQEMSTE